MHRKFLKIIRTALLYWLTVNLLVVCQSPTVPLQPVSVTGLNTPLQAKGFGPFKSVHAGQHRIRVYQKGARILENVPFVRQGEDNTCGQAVIAMLSNYWGIPAAYQQLVDNENPLNLATVAGALVSSLRQKGLQAQDFRDAGLANLIAEINQGRPTVVLLDFGGLASEHYVIVVGYDKLAQTLIIHDSLTGPYVQMPEQSFLKMWDNASLRRMMPVGSANYRRLMLAVFKS